ncbi:uncharacterized protein ACA1_288450 [Acanthamoeba castellanii str. Neff]|uniref:FYVE zinc finger domain-containing protein n=1 Tax=Acanthamoeba castellanii (strain ATCC 30010 / Neff) TaxID=1257118 RepID=L8HHU2_ACACF|nr:uncharacterized protein ACA1_288450 [Acanthamoeba castellanii str. Neff]ELR25124.1 hypothetical protein ACA1_288450 [Acanthamoeba castellanii str. Neff]
MLRELHKQRAGVTSPLKSQQGAVSKKSGAGRKGSATWGSSDLIVAPRPSWVPDKNATDCYLCAASFSIMNRRCTRFRKGLPEMGYSASNQLRVCFTCYALPVTDSIAAAAKRKRDAGDSGQSLYTSTARQRPSQREATSATSSIINNTRNTRRPNSQEKRKEGST